MLRRPWKEDNAAGIHLPSPLSSPRTLPTPYHHTEHGAQSDSKVPFNGRCGLIVMACLVVFIFITLPLKKQSPIFPRD